MTNTHMSMLELNYQYLRSSNSSLLDLLERTKCDVQLKTSYNERQLLVDDEEWISDLDNFVNTYLLPQISSPSRIFLDRVSATTETREPRELLADVIGSEDIIVLPQLPNLIQKQTLSKELILSNQELAKDAVLLGSLSLLYIDQILVSCPWIESFLLVEDDLRQLYASLHLVNLKEIIGKLKSFEKGFSLICQPNNPTPLGVHILDFYGNNNPLALNGLIVFKSLKLSPKLVQAYSWFHRQDGLLDHAKGFLGNDTDEINQTLQAIWNRVMHPDALLLKPDILSDDTLLTIVASGPSLDENLEWLYKNQDRLTIIAAASALGSLLRANIRPDIAVFLEMSSVVFQDIAELSLEGYDISSVLLICSSSIDPRVPFFFHKPCCFFHRPQLAPSVLFESEGLAFLPQAGPQAANAALEVAMQLGSRKLLLFGCDFGSESQNNIRSINALGSSPRIMTMPMRGRLGKTIYTTAQLSTTGQFFENIIKLYGATAISVGNGLYLPSIHPLNHPSEIPVDTLTQSSKISYEFFGQKLSPLSVTTDSLISYVSNTIDELNHYFDSFVSDLSSGRYLSNALSRRLSASLGWNDTLYPMPRRLLHRLSRFLLFFILQPLHDVSRNDNGQWAYELRLAQLSIGQVKNILALFLRYILFILRKPVTVMHYNELLIKRQIKSISLNP